MRNDLVAQVPDIDAGAVLYRSGVCFELWQWLQQWPPDIHAHPTLAGERRYMPGAAAHADADAHPIAWKAEKQGDAHARMRAYTGGFDRGNSDC